MQQGSSEDLCRVSRAIRAVPSEEGFVQSKCSSILKSVDMARSTSLPPELEEPRGSVSLLDITTCVALGLSVKRKQFTGWQGGWWNYILGFQFSGTSESPRPWLTFGMGFVLYLWEFH